MSGPAAGPTGNHAHFDVIADDYDDALPAHVVEHYLAKRAAFVAEHCPQDPVLDVGCGTGVLAARLAAEGREVTGVDPSAGMLELLRRRAPGLRSVEADGTALPFADDRFGTVLCVAVLHHVAHEDAVARTLAEMVRVSRPGGRVLVWDHNPRNPYWGPLMRRVPQDDGSERLVPAAEIVAGLRAAGAELVSVRQSGLVPDLVPPFAMPLARAAERRVERTRAVRRLGAHNVVVATKRGSAR